MYAQVSLPLQGSRLECFHAKDHRSPSKYPSSSPWAQDPAPFGGGGVIRLTGTDGLVPAKAQPSAAKDHSRFLIGERAMAASVPDPSTSRLDLRGVPPMLVAVAACFGLKKNRVMIVSSK